MSARHAQPRTNPRATLRFSCDRDLGFQNSHSVPVRICISTPKPTGRRLNKVPHLLTVHTKLTYQASKPRPPFRLWPRAWLHRYPDRQEEGRTLRPADVPLVHSHRPHLSLAHLRKKGPTPSAPHCPSPSLPGNKPVGLLALDRMGNHPQGAHVRPKGCFRTPDRVPLLRQGAS